MGNVLILPNVIKPAAISVDLGFSVANLLTHSPKEVFTASTDSNPIQISVDFGAPVAIDTIFLGFVSPPAASAQWSATGGISSYSSFTIMPTRTLRAVDSASRSPAMTHAFWTGDQVTARYVRLTLWNPPGAGPLSAGVLLAGKAWRPRFNMEFGHGRRVIDTGTVAQLPDGGFATMEGARKRSFEWTLGDLSVAETDELEELLLDHGETVPLLVVEDPDATTGQRNRIHYGLFTGLKAYERANPAQTKFAFTFEEWI